MSDTKIVRDLTEGNVWKELIWFAMPFMLANLLQTIYTTVDAVIVGNFVGSNALAAVTNGGNLMDFYMMLGMGFGGAGQVIVAQFVGRKDYKGLSKTIGTLFTFLFVFGLIMTIFCVSMVDWQVNILNIPEESVTAGHNYILVCGCGIIFTYGYNCVSSILRGMGDSKRPLIFIAIASIMNLILDIIFVIGLGMGAMGAALATSLGQAFSFIVAMIYLYKHREAFGFDFAFESFIPTRESLSMILRLGFPMALQSAAISLSMLFINAQINAYGVAVAAISGIGNKLESFVRIMANSMGTAGSAMVGQCMGAGKKDRVPKVVRCVFTVAEGTAVILALIMIFFARSVIGLFSSDEEVLALCNIYRGVAATFYLSYGFRSAYNTVVNGIGFATLGLFSGLMDGVVARIGLAMLFGTVFGWGITGYWYGSALAGFVSAAITGIYYYSGKWRTRKLITQ